MVRDYSNRYARLKMGAEQRAKYGNVWHFMLGPFNFLPLADPDYVLAAWKTQRNMYDKGVFTKTMVGTFLGMQSILVNDEAVHNVNRKMIAPAFHYAKLQSMVTIMVDCTEKAVTKLTQSITAAPAGNNHIELHDFFLKLSFDILYDTHTHIHIHKLIAHAHTQFYTTPSLTFIPCLLLCSS